MNRGPKASMREFRRPRAGDQGDEAPPPGPPTLSSVPGPKPTSRCGTDRSLRPYHAKREPGEPCLAEPNEPTRTQESRLHRPFLAEEALASKVSLRWHVDSAVQAER